MDLTTLMGTLESNLTRELVSTIDGDVVSYFSSTPKTVTINDTAYLNSNRLCLISKNNTVYLYITAYDYKKISKISIADITTITIT